MNARKKQLIFSLLVILAGLSAGAAASALIADSIIGSMQFSQGAGSVLPRQTLAPNATRVTEARRSAVVFYKKPAGTALLDKILIPSERVGAGTVITADGWIMTASAALAGREQLIAVLADGSSLSFDPAGAVRDEATGAAFIKIDAQRLAVASLGDDISVGPGDIAFALDADAIKPVAVTDPRRLPVQTKYDLVESTEILGRRSILDASVLAGSAIVNADGMVVGIAAGDALAIPISAASELFRGLFTDGKIARPRAGIRYVSLDMLVNAKNSSLPETGALVTGGGKYKAIEKGSAGEAAGLRENDVIIAVEHDRINDEETLSERLQDYAPGSKVELTVNRDGKQIKIEITLK